MTTQNLVPADPSAVAALLSEMKVTKGSRFNASKRLEERARKRTANTAYASAAVVVITLLPVFFPVPQLVANGISLTTVALSILILASSLLQTANQDHVLADQFQRCALEINALRREMRARAIVSEADLCEYTSRFDGILRRYNINHDDVDYEKYKLEHPQEYPEEAPEEKTEARKDVRASNALLDRLRIAILAVTIALVAAAVASPVAQWVGALVDWFRPPS